MGIIGAVANFAMPPWLRVALKLAPYVAIAILLAALLQTRGTLHNARQDAKLLAEHSAAELAKAQTKWAMDGKNASDAYAIALATREPITVRSTNEVTRYAQTPAGAAVCAPAERVSSTDLLDRQLWPAQPAKSGD